MRTIEQYVYFRRTETPLNEFVARKNNCRITIILQLIYLVIQPKAHDQMTSVTPLSNQSKFNELTHLKSFKWLLFPIAGVMQTLSLSPFNAWPLGILSITLIMFGLQGATPRKSFLFGWLFGLGLFGTGTSWVYISINQFGNAPAPLAAFLTAIFIAGIALFSAFTFWGYRKLFNQDNRWSVILFPAVWVLGDWFRSWFLTGFPWVYLGYGHIETPLAGWASILGVYGITFICCLSGSAIWYFLSCSTWASKILNKLTKRELTSHHQSSNNKILPKNSNYKILSKNSDNKTPPKNSNNKMLAPSFIGFAVTLWIIGALASNIEWSYVKQSEPISIAAVQGNIPQELKWNRDYRLKSIQIYKTLSAPHWGKDLIIWPETAIPMLYDQAKPIIFQISELAQEKGSTLITGIPYSERNSTTGQTTIHNSILSIGNGENIYHKQKLVPFGEYIPLEDLLRGLIQFFDLPMSSFSAGPTEQHLLKESSRSVSPYICYEIVYPDFVAKNAKDADYLLTISNDSWFGRSIGPLQHLEMVQMRALENARYIVRATNNGISAVISPDGRIQSQSEQFIRTVLTGEVYAMGGRTPFNYTGSAPILLLCLFIIILRRFVSRRL